MSRAKMTRYYDNEEKPVEAPSKARDLLDETSSLQPSTSSALGAELGSQKFNKQESKNVKLEDTVDPEALRRYHRGRGMKLSAGSIKTKFHRVKFADREKKVLFSSLQAARSEILFDQTAGCIEPDPGKFSNQLSQTEIAASVDMASATKHFQLDLPRFGPYTIDYTRNGRHLLLGGKNGHVAALDWVTKKLHCEINAMETVRDVKWLHLETMFAVSQKKWTYIYDSQGTELHCLKNLHHCLQLEFLPYHFLLAGSAATSFLHWMDVSVGKLVSSFPIREGRLDLMTQNPTNAVICLAHPKGTVTMWSPNVKEPLVKMLCHRSPVRGIAVDPSTGRYMATTGLDRRLCIWDLRMHKRLASHLVPVGLSNLHFSQRGLLAASVGTNVQVYKDVTREDGHSSPYLSLSCSGTVSDVQFCPYEDVLGIGHQAGFLSGLIPGAGEPNIDALVANPFQSAKQRKEFEVKSLLDKIQPDMITLERSLINEVNQDALEENMDAQSKIKYLKPPEIKLRTKKKKTIGRSGMSDAKKAKKMADQNKLAMLKNKALAEKLAKVMAQDSSSCSGEEYGEDGVDTALVGRKRLRTAVETETKPKSVLDRFQKNKT